MTWAGAAAGRLAIGFALALALSGCATKDMDECYRGERSRCPGSAALSATDQMVGLDW